MRVVIVSIFKNERPYILEWLAHYKSLGFNDFIIGDNCSDDGTTELLEALDSAGVITRVHQPIHKYCSPKGPQLDFYERALSEYSDKYDVFGFLDADEFLYGEEGVSPLCELERLFSDPAVSAVGVNWRVFGVTEVEDETKLVTKRIVKSSSLDSPANKCIKSFVRPSKVMKMNCHRAELIDGKYVDASGELIDFEDGQGFGEMMQYVPNTKLRVAHYIVKSKTEFYEKKQKRGRAGVGASREDNLRTDAYFGNHSQYSEECLDLACRNSEIVKNIRNLKSDLMLNSNYYSQYSIVVTKILSDRIFGWVECLGQDLVDIVTVKATVSGLYECYVRDVVSYMESWYKQWVKDPVVKYKYDFDTFFEKYKGNLNFKEEVDSWTKYISNNKITVRDYDEVILSKSICKDFSQIVGVDYESLIEEFGTTNQSLGYVGTSILREVNKYGDVHNRNIFLGACLNIKDSGEYSGKKFINDSQKSELEEIYSRGIADMKNSYGISS